MWHTPAVTKHFFSYFLFDQKVSVSFIGCVSFGGRRSWGPNRKWGVGPGALWDCRRDRHRGGGGAWLQSVSDPERQTWTGSTDTRQQKVQEKETRAVWRFISFWCSWNLSSMYPMGWQGGIIILGNTDIQTLYSSMLLRVTGEYKANVVLRLTWNAVQTFSEVKQEQNFIWSIEIGVDCEGWWSWSELWRSPPVCCYCRNL